MPKFDLDEILVRKLAGLLDETGLSEIEYESAGQRIRVARNGGMRPGAEAASPGSATVGISRQAPSGARDGDEKVPAGAITSPMVGTAYLGPEPGAAPFVQVGDTIEEGQILIIIEAMKVMNPIPSPRAGNVLRILVSDGQPVEYGEPLMVIE